MSAALPSRGKRSCVAKSRRWPCAFTAQLRCSAVAGRLGIAATSSVFCSTIFSRIFNELFFLIVGNTGRAFEGATGAPPRVDERIEIAIHHRLHVAGGMPDPQVFNQTIRLKHITP